MTIKINLSETLAAKAYLMLFNEMPTPEKLQELSGKTVDMTPIEKEDAEQSLMMAMFFLAAAE